MAYKNVWENQCYKIISLEIWARSSDIAFGMTRLTITITSTRSWSMLLRYTWGEHHIRAYNKEHILLYFSSDMIYLTSSSRMPKAKIILEREAPRSTSSTLVAEAFAMLMGLNHVERLYLHQVGIRSDFLRLNNLLISNSLTHYSLRIILFDVLFSFHF